jgi:hypothetical protein
MRSGKGNRAYFDPSRPEIALNTGSAPVLARFCAIIAVIAATIVPVRADVMIISDPDQWIDQALQKISEGKTDEFARDFLKLIDQSDSFDSFADNLRVLSQLGPPAFMDKVVDVKYGDALREVIYVALYRKTDYMYFRFTIKKNVGGYLISNFAFKNEASDLFPPDFTPPPPH